MIIQTEENTGTFAEIPLHIGFHVIISQRQIPMFAFLLSSQTTRPSLQMMMTSQTSLRDFNKPQIITKKIKNFISVQRHTHLLFFSHTSLRPRHFSQTMSRAVNIFSPLISRSRSPGSVLAIAPSFSKNVSGIGARLRPETFNMTGK